MHCESIQIPITEGEADLLPSKMQWKRWSLPSRLTAIGTYVGIAGFLITFISLMMPKSGDENYVRDTLAAIQKDVVKSTLFFQNNDLSPDFTSQEAALNNLERLNEFGSGVTASFDYARLSNLLKEYGNDQSNEKFTFYINDVHQSSLKLSQLVVDVLNSKGPQTQEELNHLTSRYVELLNRMSASYHEYHSFIINLRSEDFV